MRLDFTRLLASFVLVALAAAAQQPVPPGFVVSEDMILPEEALHGEGAWTGTPWTGNLVPYVFNANVSQANRTLALQAMNEVDALCAAGFIPRTSQTNYIEFVDTNVNRSSVGMVGGRQFIEMFNWTTKYIIVHELFHALGFVHEHQRSDRNSFVTINSGNYAATNAVNFDIISNSTNATGYDFLSIMHYGGTAFTTNGQNTITCNAGNAAFQNQIGNRTFLTVADAQGLQARYGVPNVPYVTGANPSSVAAGSGWTTVNLTCGNAYAGSPTNQGVQGTRVKVNGQVVTTSFLGVGLLSAQIPPSFFTLPGNLTVTLESPAPGGGNSVSSVTITVICAPGFTTNLPAFSPVVISNPCTTWATNPGPAWNVVAVSPQCGPGVNFCSNDWDISVGATSSAFGSSQCDFLAGHYYGPPPPVFTGNCFRYLGTGDAVMESVSATALTIGTPSISGLSSGSIVRAFSWYGAGAKNVSVSGAAGLSWAVLSNNGSWRGRPTAVASGSTASNTVTTPVLVNDGHVLVVCRDGGASPDYLPFTVQVCSPTAAVSLIAGPAIAVTGPCQAFNSSPVGGKWNLVGVSSTSDWDVNLGTGVSQFGGATGDFVVANGHLGTISPTNGSLSRYSGSAGAVAQLAFPQTFTVPGSGNGPTYGFGLAEFQILNAGNYDLVCSGTPGYSWSLFAPGSNAAWRARDSAALTGSADGSTTGGVFLNPGWYAVGFAPDTGPPVFLANFSVIVIPSAVQPPVIASVTPNPVEAAMASLYLTVDGDNYDPAAEVWIFGSAVPTTYVSTTQLIAYLDISLILQSGVAPVQVQIPGSGLSASNVVNLTINNPVPMPSALSPDAIAVGLNPQTFAVIGSAFVPDSEVRVNGVAMATTYISDSQLDITIPGGTYSAPGSADVEVFNPAPVGGISLSLPLALHWPVPDLTSISLPTVSAGSATTTISLYGGNFTPVSEARLEGVPLLTTFVSDGEVQAVLPEGLLLVPGYPNFTVFNPAPGGGESVPVGLYVVAPSVVGFTPSYFAPLLPTDPDVPLVVTGTDFLPTSVIYANGEPLATIYLDAFNLSANLPATVLQTQRLGAVLLNVANTPLAVSNSVPLLVGAGNGVNYGTLRRQPLAPALGDAYDILFESGYPSSPLTIIIDAGNPEPIGAWPDAATDFVLAVTDLAGSPGPWLAILDGIGLFGPSTGTQYDPSGAFILPGLVRQNPALGIDLTAQAVFLDPTAALGFTLTWARFPESL